jgi:hypothetical protein
MNTESETKLSLEEHQLMQTIKHVKFDCSCCMKSITHKIVKQKLKTPTKTIIRLFSFAPTTMEGNNPQQIQAAMHILDVLQELNKARMAALPDEDPDNKEMHKRMKKKRWQTP